MKWVVLSDLHMNFRNCTTRIARTKLIEQLEKENVKGKISFIVITGDCFHKNTGDSKELIQFITNLAKSCNLRTDKVILCPGNHDVNREDRKRNEMIQNYRHTGVLPSMEICLEGYAKFRELYSLIYRKQYQPFAIKNINEFKIISVDSCLLSMDDKDYGHLVVNFDKLADLSEEIKKDNKINIVVMHHGVEWLQPEDGRRFQHWLSDNNVKMVFCGHNHAPGMNILTEAIEPQGIPRDGIPQFTCGCTLSDSYSKPVFLVGEYDYDNTKSFKMKLYEYNDNSNWELTNGILRSFPTGIYKESTTNGLIKNSYDIPKIYETIFDIGDDVAAEIKSSKCLDFFGLRGGTFLKDNSKIANALYEKKDQISCRLLVSNPYNINIEKRLRSVPEFSSQLKLEEQWKVNYLDIKKLRDNFPQLSSWNLRFHEQPLLFRFIMTEFHVYVGYYTKEPSSKSCMYRYTDKSAIYRSLRDFFDSVWESGTTNFPTVVPDRCSFVLDRFNMKPSLVINLTSVCNMACKYCPSGGENLKMCNDLCDIEQIKYLLTAYANYYRKNGWTEKKVVRITGGEPLMNFIRILDVLKHAKVKDYEKIVLCTNGLLLKECYESSPEIWESVKNILLLKISLDSMDPERFKKLTGSDELQTVLANIKFAKRKGFRVELNFVATKRNVQEIETIYNYAHRMKLVGIKVLTVNDFGGRIESDDVEKELDNLIKKMRKKNYVETGLYVHNNKGIYMKRFIHDGCTLTIVDHMNKRNSITPRRTYSETCQLCEYYPESREVQAGINKPCATGIMSLTMRADGVLSFCRMMDSGVCLNGKTLNEVQGIVETQLKNFENCYHYEIGEGK